MHLCQSSIKLDWLIQMHIKENDFISDKVNKNKNISIVSIYIYQYLSFNKYIFYCSIIEFSKD